MKLRQSKMILYVTKQAAVASFWRGQCYQSHQVYQNEIGGHEAFRQYVSQHKEVIVYVIVDVIEEEYQLVLLPHVTGSAKHEMLARKLTQFCQQSLYKAALFLRKEKAARQEDYYLLFALANTDSLKHWLNILHVEKALLAGMTALPIISQMMVRTSKPLSPQLLVCERLSSGLRISYLWHGHLRVSRLTPIVNIKPAQLVDFYLVEIKKMQLYMLSQKIMSDEDELEVRLVAFGAAHNGVAIVLEQRGLRCKINDRHHDIGKHRLRQSDVEAHPELLHMQWLANENKLKNLAPVGMIRKYLIKRFAKRLTIGMTVLVMIGLLISIGLLCEAYEKQSQRRLLIEQISVLTKNQALITVSAAPSKNLKSAVALAESINQMPSSPLSLMQVVSTALTDEPNIVINRVYWTVSEHLHIKAEEVEKLLENSNEKNQHGLLEFGFLNAEIKSFTGDYAEALAIVNRFIKKLQTAKNVMSVKVLEMPVNIVSSSQLQGNTREKILVHASPTFKLKVILKRAVMEAKI